MRNPCRNCKYLHKDKNGEVCLNCPARLEYVRYLADPDNFVPRMESDQARPGAESKPGEVPMETKTESLPPEQEQTESAGAQPEKKKVCRQCRRELPADADHFYRQKPSADGLDPLCKQCKAENQRDYQRRKTGKPQAKSRPDRREKPEAAAQSRELSPDEAARPVSGKGEDASLVLDFTDYPELLDRLRTMGRESFRPPEMQALYCIERMVSGEQRS